MRPERPFKRNFHRGPRPQRPRPAPESAPIDPSVIAGRKPVLEALESGKPLEKIFIQFGTHGPAMTAIYTLAKQKGVIVRQTPKGRFAELAPGVETQGVVAIASAVETLELEDVLERIPKGEPPFLLVLDEIEDPHNLGALIRSALCFGLHGVVIPRHHAATVNATVVKTSAGAALTLPIARVTNIAETVKELKERNIWVVGADAAAEKAMDEVQLTGPVALVVGNEGRGLRRLVKENCDQLIKIPMAGSFDSLNASVAGAVIMYAVSRQRKP